MAHAPATERKLEAFISKVARMELDALAAQWLGMGEELLEIDDLGAAKATWALIAIVDAIGEAKFPREWKEAQNRACKHRDAN